MGGDMKKMIVGIIMIVVALLMFGIVLDSVATLLAWSSGGSTIATFTGLQQLVTISPLLIFIGLLAGGGWLTFSGFSGVRSSGGKKPRKLH